MMKHSIDAPCAGCGSEQSKVFLSGRSLNWAPDQKFTLVQCNDCGLIRLRERVAKEEVSARYSYGFTGCRSSLFLYPYLRVMDYFMGLRRRKVEQCCPNGRILDIGCGEGLFLKHMCRHNWESWGVDASSCALSCVAQDANIRLQCGSPEEAVLPAEYFDAVTFWHSFEHMEKPIQVLKEAYGVLKDNGILLISVPHIESFEARFFRQNWFGFEVPGHKFFYSERTLKRMLENNNFEVLGVSKNSLEYNYPFFAQSFFNFLGGEFNFLQKSFKGFRDKREKPIVRRAYTILLIAALFPLSVFLATGAYLVYSAINNGPVLEVRARKK